MLYSMIEMHRAAAAPMRMFARANRIMFESDYNVLSRTEFGKSIAATSSLFESLTRSYGKPVWGLEHTEINGKEVSVDVETVWSDAWCNLVHFQRDPEELADALGDAAPQPRLLIVAPLSGHYATLLRGTVEALLPHFEVYITDWTDARMVPLFQGRFSLDDYIDYVRRMIGEVGPGSNVLAVCQPGPPTLAAIALMSEDNDPNVPASMTFMGSPIDCRKSPTVPNLLAEERPFEWFEENMIYTVPMPYPGAMRRVYPGFVQLSSFMNMNWERHVDAHWSFFEHLVGDDGDSASKHREFYDEYLSVLDLSAEFYLDTIKRIFQNHELPLGTFMHRGRLVKPSTITKTALMTVECEKDDISGIGQTQAAHDLCSNLPEDMQLDYIQPGVGHYGVFNGSRFRKEIVPRVVNFIHKFHDTKLESEWNNAFLMAAE
ncbi:polyhydroxyalkanoate depolymerase [Ponticaulis sp.]|uniref:polyhydroxyalkanoate depolymerase n=1 Tax=Ponticaulis sp. TaxID=2020902 RepID=UPI000B6B50B0|nr:polyhydroxyalkanoate depolymerase [Ponticaulis sp.]MAJ07659.1 polyhydroxyalkanoate depolymerase [Ponticaulis sp.]RPG17885.1 MAG: polyhydroxyalkanoate depolymerase [Hyphomonadaceae bacterium TMED125]